MLQLTLACLLFLGIHVLISGTALRGRLVAFMGTLPYRGLFSLLSAGALAWMIVAFQAAPYVELWPETAALRWLNLLLNLLAVPLVTLGILSPNPTSAGQERLMHAAEPARGIIRITRHPFLVGVALWAAGHIASNGDLAALILFGSLLALTLIGPRLIDAKAAARNPETWARLSDATSWLPFAAIAQGRNRLVLGEIGLWRIAVAAVLYFGIVFYLHALAGLPVLPT